MLKEARFIAPLVRPGLLLALLACACAGAGCGGDDTGGVSGQIAAGSDPAIAAKKTAPRLLAPLSGSRDDSRQPVFLWTPAVSGTVQICDDRACARVLASVPGANGSAQPAAPLPS